MSNTAAGVDRARQLGQGLLRVSGAIVLVEAELSLKEERVGDLHLPMRSQAWTLVDGVIIIFLRSVNVNQTFLPQCP